MNTKDEALRLSIDALRNCRQFETWDTDDINEAIRAIEEVLAQPEQKPFCWVLKDGRFIYRVCNPDDIGAIPLYASPQPEQAPVAAQCRFTNEEWKQCSIAHHLMVNRSPQEWVDYETRLLYASPPPAQPTKDSHQGSGNSHYLLLQKPPTASLGEQHD